ncbi:aminoglycoside phosphotransferase family protein [Paenibacillus doosanensis]|uniref:Hygromycin-B 4-O-kinase n=1 Tax=Paenibacillus konkukensis TaxID=2020716 RepID=A0ABY4RUU1_9BACL|nr:MULTISPECIES: aminoglycoside phosphotransferase family protein [Paenibacillus]MCS7460288.1 aminoglycoside phosphotransferase family protein [Paenibacillus doosanensis]UQZ86166.1 Hygromycin-B 4-O-kinase [Paenibacillus konkukensis]
MKTFKPEMSAESALHYLQQIAGEDITGVTPIEMGELSRVFSFRDERGEHVIHFKNSRESFDRAGFIAEHYSGCGVPIPRLEAVGELGDMYYAISEKVPGKPVSLLSPQEIREIAPRLIDTFTALCGIPIDSAAGCGWIAPSGKAPFDDWTAFLESAFAERQQGFFENWRALFDGGILEKDVFDAYYGRMVELSRFAPAERYLVHGDFHFGNMLSDGRTITGIVDWEIAMYGDFMLDAAVLHMWAPQLQFPYRVRERWAAEGRAIPYFEERLLCYLLFKGLDGLRFYAKKEDRAAYDFMKNKLSSFAALS